MNTEKQTTSHVDKPLKSHMQLVVTGVNGIEVSADIWPTVLTATQVAAVVGWEGTDVITTIVRAEGDKSVQTRLLTLAAAATGPNCVQAIPTLSGGSWEMVRLTMPDVGLPDCWIHIELHREQWSARVSTSPASALASTLEITTELRHHEVGTVLFEMSSRLLNPRQRLASGLGLDALSNEEDKK